MLLTPASGPTCGRIRKREMSLYVIQQLDTVTPHTLPEDTEKADLHQG